jgi:hypothetical protein
VAYRQLCAVTFAVLGWLAVGCGGGTGSNAAANATEQQPPSNSDQPPSNTDQASNPDQAPSSSDTPPSSADDTAGSGNGGRLGALCQQFCQTLSQVANDCSGDMLGMQDFCSGDAVCQVPADVPCQTEIGDAFSCIIDNIKGICSAPAQGSDAPNGAVPCEDTVKGLTTCLDGATNGGGGNNNGNGNGNGNTPGSCSAAGGCDCATDCLSCLCDAGTDSNAVQECSLGVCSAP